MAAPVAVQKLSHGKALCGKTFGKFVETFNWLVDFCQGLQGDRDANKAGDGRIEVDRSDPSAPVIRYCKAGGGGGAGGYTIANGCWNLEDGVLTNCYYNVGGVTYHTSDKSTDATDGILYAQISSGVVSVGVAANLNALNQLQANEADYVVPLYILEDGEITVDFRLCPHIQVFEGHLS